MNSKSSNSLPLEAAGSSWITLQRQYPHLSAEDAVRTLWDAHAPVMLLDRRDPPYHTPNIVVGLEPDYAWELRDGKGQLRSLRGDGEASGNGGDQPSSLKDAVARLPVPPPPGFPASVGGLLGYVGYEFIRSSQGSRSRGRDPFGCPAACLVRPTVFLVLQQREALNVRIAVLVAPTASQGTAPANERAALLAEQILAELASPASSAAREVSRKEHAKGRTSQVRPSLGRERYAEKFRIAQEMIAAGALTQVGIAQRFEVSFEHHPLDLWSLMTRNNPSPLGFALGFADRAYVGMSPRVLVRLEPGEVVTRPIGGTRRRPSDRQLDARIAEELLQDQKEVGEHLMLLEAWLDDLRPIVQGGDVEVVERLKAEFFSHVIHIGSTLRGRPSAGLGPVEVLEAVFPAPTVVGSPKREAIAALDELEDEQRGLYGGCVGYIGAGDWMEMHIAIRSALVKDESLHVNAGAGIVAESDVGYEYGEMESKAASVLTAVRQLDEMSALSNQRRASASP